MKLSTLKRKLEKLEVEFKTSEYNCVNHTLIFSLCGIEYDADYNVGVEDVKCYSTSYSYDNATQETQRRFFYSFNQVLEHSERFKKD